MNPAKLAGLAWKPWIDAMRALLADTPPGWHVHALDDNLFVAGPEATAVIGGASPADVGSAALEQCADWVPLGRIRDSGGW